MILSLMRTFGGSAFDHRGELLKKEKGIAVSKVQNTPAPVEEHSIEGGVPQAVTEGSSRRYAYDGASELRSNNPCEPRRTAPLLP